MGFLSGLKGLFGAAQPPQPVSVVFSETKQWLETQTQSRLKELKADSLNRFAEIRFLLKELSRQLDGLEQQGVESETGNHRLRKVVSSSQRALVSRMRGLLQKLQPPQVAEWQELQTYGANAFPLLQKETASFGKNIAYTSILLKDEVKGIGARLQELEKNLKHLFEAFSGDSLLTQTQTAHRLYQELVAMQEKQRALSHSAYLLEKQIKTNEKRVAEQKTVLAQLQDSETARELEALMQQLGEIENNKQALNRELRDSLARIDKPLKRFNQLVAVHQWSLEKNTAVFLRLLMRDPVVAFESDPKAQLFQTLLNEIQQAIHEKKVSAKDEKEKTKWLKELEQLLGVDFFSSFFWKQNELEKRSQKIEKQVHGNDFAQKLGKETKQLQALRTETQQSKTRLQQNQAALKKNLVQLTTKKLLLEKQLSKIVAAEVTVSFPQPF